MSKRTPNKKRAARLLGEAMAQALSFLPKSTIEIMCRMILDTLEYADDKDALLLAMSVADVPAEDHLERQEQLRLADDQYRQAHQEGVRRRIDENKKNPERATRRALQAALRRATADELKRLGRDEGAA